MNAEVPFASIVRSLGDGLIVFNPQQTITFANERAQNLLGLPQSTLLTLTAPTLWDCPALRLEAAEVSRRRFEGLFENIEGRPTLTLAFHNGPLRREAELQLFPLRDDAGERCGAGLALRDITHEQEMAQRRDELVNMVSHELRTPLTNILCFSDLLLTREFPEARRRQMLQTIHRESKRLSALLTDFLHLRRLESGRQALRLSEFQFSDLVAEVIAGFELSRSRHQLQVDLPAGLPPLHADREKLGQVVRNLLDNAFKYSPQGGPVTITARVVGDQEAIYAAVTDQGLGLPSEDIPQLFQRFYRVDTPDRREITGTGLGLAIIKQIIEAHEGRVWAESQGPSRGSTFGFTLPLNHSRPGRQTGSYESRI